MWRLVVLDMAWNDVSVSPALGSDVFTSLCFLPLAGITRATSVE